MNGASDEMSYARDRGARLLRKYKKIFASSLEDSFVPPISAWLALLIGECQSKILGKMPVFRTLHRKGVLLADI